MNRFLGGLVAALMLATNPAHAFEFGFEGAKSATATEIEAETGVATKYPQWVQGRVEAGQRDWFWDHCSAYVEKMGLAAFTNVSRCLGTHYRINGERNLDRINPGDTFWMVDLGSDPATVQAAFTAAAEAEAKAAADAAIAPIRDALLGNKEFRAEVAALVEGSAEGVNPWTTPEELEGLRAELFAELEKLGTGPTAEDLEALLNTLLDERGYITANVDTAVAKALEDSGLAGRLTEVENRVTVVEGSLANLSTTVDEQGKAIANLPSREDVEGIVDERIASVNAADRNWLYSLTAFLALAFGLMGYGYYRRRPLWKRVSDVEGKVDVASAAALEAKGEAGEAVVKANAAHTLAQRAFELTFNGHTLNGQLPDFHALSLGGVANVSLINFEGAEATVTFERVEKVSDADTRPGLKVAGVGGQTNPLPLDSGINRRVLAMLANATKGSRLDFGRSAIRPVVAPATAPAPASTSGAEAGEGGQPALEFVSRRHPPKDQDPVPDAA